MALRWRIALPFCALFGFLFGVAILVAVGQVTSAVERKLAVRAEHLARLLSRTPGLMSETMLGYIREAYDAEIVVEMPETVGTPVMSTLPGTSTELRSWMTGGRIRREGDVLQEIPPLSGSEKRYLAAYGSMEIDRGLVLLYPAEVVEAEKKRTTKPLAAVAVGGLLLVVVLSYLTARAVARPVEELAELALDASDGRLDVEVPKTGGGRELGHLAGAFRHMLSGLRKHQENLVRSERLAVLGQMAAGIAHEIRNPLAAMKLTVQMLREEERGRLRESCDVLLREIERLELTTTELFSAAHPSRLQKESVSVPQLTEEILVLLHRQLEHLGIRVVREFDEAGDVFVDRNVFKRAVLNLVLNGAQAMPGGGELRIGTERREGRIRFYVRDGGKGIPAEIRAKIFEPFVTTKKGGIGLGLAVTKRIIEDHGGRIGFETSESGTTFWIEMADARAPQAA